MVTAVFKNNNTERVRGLWQYDYGQVLRIQGLILPTAVEIDFSLQETGGESTSRVGITRDGVTDVVIPDSMLENGGATQDYSIYAFIYLTDETSGKTIKKIIMSVNSRPKPEAFDAPEDAELFREAIAAVNKSAGRAETAEATAEAWAHGHADYPERDEDNAKYYADESKKDAEETKKERTAVSELAEHIDAVAIQVNGDKTDTDQYKNQASVSATKALQSEQAAKSSETAAMEAQAGAEAAEGQAELFAAQTEEDKNTVEQAKDVVMGIGQEVAENRNYVEQSVGSFGLIHQQAVADVNNAGQAQTERVEGAGDQAVKDINAAGTTQINATNSAGEQQIKAVEDAGSAQVSAVQEAAAEIIADRDQIAENKNGISELKSDLVDNIGYQKLAFDFVKGAYFGGNIADFKLTEHIAEGVYWAHSYDNTIYVEGNTLYSCFSIRIKPNTIYTSSLARYVVLSVDGIHKNGTMLENVKTFNSGDNNFAFISVNNNKYDSFVINEGTTEVTNGYYEIPLLKTKAYLDNTIIVESKNLFEDNDVVDGFISSASGTSVGITEHSDWKTTGYLPVEYGKHYYATYCNSNNIRKQDAMKYLFEFDADRSFVAKKESGLKQRESYTPSSQNVKYVRWSFHSTDVSAHLFEETYGGTGYEEKGKREVFVRDNLIGAYNGIKWGCFGDSITDINIYANVHYYDWISEVDGFKVANYGYSGTGYKNGNESGIDFVTRMNNIIPSTFDFMTVMGTFNDASLISSSFPIGTKTDSGGDTLCGCINATIDAYYSVAIDKPIGFITPPPTLYRNPTNEVAEQIVQAILDICEYRCIPCLDLYHEIGLNVWYGTDEQKQKYLTSFFTENGQTDINGVHLNSIAHKLFIAPKVREFVHSLVMPN